MATNLNGKRILITAGPTWVAIDAVRVISNTASGKTGILLAKVLARLGAKVTLLLGPVETCCIDKRIRVIDFKFFDELDSSLKKELKGKRFDIVIHSAAVSDYRPKSVSRKKISSSAKNLSLTLKQTPKIINHLRKISPGSLLIGFKFEPGLSENSLINKARSLIKRAQLDLAVANTAGRNGYKAWIVSTNEELGPFSKKEELVINLSALIKNAGN